MMMFGCGPSKNVASNGEKDMTSDEKKVSEGISVIVYTTFTSAHCGGVAPTPEQEKSYRTPSPYTGQKIFIRKGEKNNIYEPLLYTLASDDSGKVEMDLPEGKYSVVFENKAHQSTFDELIDKYREPTDNYEAIDKECLVKFFETPAGVLDVKKDGDNQFNINYQKKCSWGRIPCAMYNGPLPP